MLRRQQRSVWLNHMTLCRAGGSSVVTSLSLTTRQGSTIPVQLVSAPFERSEGGFSYRTAITDLTEREHAEEEIRRLNAELEDRVQQRTGELQDAIERLREEVAQRIAAEDQLKEYAAGPRIGKPGAAAGLARQLGWPTATSSSANASHARRLRKPTR